jgi:hypothetical protein
MRICRSRRLGSFSVFSSIEVMHVLGGCCGTDHRHVAAICDACRSALPDCQRKWPAFLSAIFIS